MKKLLALVSISIIISCNTNKKMNSSEKGNFLEGIITKQDLLKEPYSNWFNRHYEKYKVNKILINELKDNPSFVHNTQIKILMGTWCEDSQEQVPHLIKILDYLNFKNYTIIGLNKVKKSEKGYENGLNIIRVPTFIVLQNRGELNRVIETPKKTLEQDLVDILVNKNYTPNSF